MILPQVLLHPLHRAGGLSWQITVFATFHSSSIKFTQNSFKFNHIHSTFTQHHSNSLEIHSNPLQILSKLSKRNARADEVWPLLETYPLPAVKKRICFQEWPNFIGLEDCLCNSCLCNHSGRENYNISASQNSKLCLNTSSKWCMLQCVKQDIGEFAVLCDAILHSISGRENKTNFRIPNFRSLL